MIKIFGLMFVLVGVSEVIYRLRRRWICARNKAEHDAAKDAYKQSFKRDMKNNEIDVEDKPKGKAQTHNKELAELMGFEYTPKGAGA